MSVGGGYDRNMLKGHIKFVLLYGTNKKKNNMNLMFIGPCIIAIVDEWKTNLMSFAILFHLLRAHHVSDIRTLFVLQASACKTNTTKNRPHQISNTQRTENKTTDVVIHQHSRKLLKMDILMSEIWWAHNKWNKIASDIKLVFHSSKK